ncbi:MAG: hypothetical protein KGL39_31545 [Patescibacteria group bacterium]|nr:hypothetical protein [Patescibacteria group bacterium]
MTLPNHPAPYTYTTRFSAADLNRLDLLEDEKHLAYHHADFLESLERDDEKRKICGIAFWNDLPLYIGGYFEISPGVAQVFFVLDKRSLEHPLVLVRSIARWRKWLESRPWCHRIETHSLPLDHIRRWMTKLGFVYEGKLNQYTGQGDYELWSRYRLDGIWRPI